MSTHSQGDWHIGQSRTIFCNDTLIGFVCVQGVTDAEAHANAKLMAASPRMMETLRAMTVNPTVELIEQAREIIYGIEGAL